MKRIKISVICVVSIAFLTGCSLFDSVSRGAMNVFEDIICKVNSSQDATHETEGIYIVKQINSNINRSKSNEDYFYGNMMGIYHYSIQDKKLDKIVSNMNIYDFEIAGDYLYYTPHEDGNKPPSRLIKKNYRTGEETLIVKSESDSISLSIYNDNLIWDECKDHKYTYICPLGGNPEEESVDVNLLFKEDDVTGKQQTTVYKGMVICRQYDVEEGYYDINYIREEKTNRTLMYDYEEEAIDFYGKRIVFRNVTEGESTLDSFQYNIEGEQEWHLLSCFVDNHAGIYGNYLTVENGTIIGLISIPSNVQYNYQMYQRDLDRDILFQLNPQTRESSIIFDAEDNRTRIIGYQDSMIYLLRDYKIYRQAVNSEKLEELIEIPRNDEYLFDWQGDYLIIRYDDYKHDYEVAATYKIKDTNIQ